MAEEEIVLRNLRILDSPEVRDIALSESVGGNAGTACYALNLEIADDGSIASVGNRPERVNATLRVYVPAFRTRTPKMKEMVIELSGEVDSQAKRPVSKAAWLWNLGRVPSERDLIRRFMDGKLKWAALLEFLRSKYPELVKELE